MAFAYQVMYRIGFTPWDQHETSQPLTHLIKDETPGHLLDIGCGTGKDAVFAASNGWRVTGVDAVAPALRKARVAAAEAGVEVRLVHGDITRLQPSNIGDDFSVVQDMGCIAGLSDDGRVAAAKLVTEVSLSGAHLLLFYFGPGGGNGPGPRRLDPAQVPSLFPGWDVEMHRPADEVPINGPMRNAPRFWHQLVKR
jgi:SAM-dependent methyltransferase